MRAAACCIPCCGLAAGAGLRVPAGLFLTFLTPLTGGLPPRSSVQSKDQALVYAKAQFAELAGGVQREGDERFDHKPTGRCRTEGNWAPLHTAVRHGMLSTDSPPEVCALDALHPITIDPAALRGLSHHHRAGAWLRCCHPDGTGWR